MDTQEQQSVILNKKFSLLDSCFKENNWELIENEMNHIKYAKNKENDYVFDIKIDKSNIIVSIPLKNSIYNYVTRFDNYFLASEYLEARLHELIQ